MTKQVKPLSKQALNKIVNGLLEDGTYNSKATERMLAAEAEYNEARKLVNAEVGLVLDKLEELEGNILESRKGKKMSQNDRYLIINNYDEARSTAYDTRISAGYSYEGYDALQEVWNSSSMHC
jgi:hypothetical protein